MKNAVLIFITSFLFLSFAVAGNQPTQQAEAASTNTSHHVSITKGHFYSYQKDEHDQKAKNTIARAQAGLN